MHTNINSKEIYDNKSLDLAVCIGGDGAFLDGGYGGSATITRMSFSGGSN